MQDEKIYKSVHEVLARSYFAFFLFIILGLTLSFFTDKKMFVLPQNSLGLSILILGTFFVLWAQNSSRKTKAKRIHPDKEISSTGFIKGPYKFFRSPTHIGIFILSLGLAFLVNSVVLVISSILAFVFTKVVFIPKEEKMLKEKYGEAYEDYKRKVRI